MFIDSTLQVKKAQCKRLKSSKHEASVSDRQERIEGWDQSKVEGTTILLQGCGGINGVIGQGLVRQGYGALHCVDPDVVQHSNLHRQIFLEEDIYKSKGHAFVHRLSESGFLGTKLIGYPLYFSEFVEQHPEVKPDIVVSGVDNNKARAEALRYCHARGIPLVALGVARDGSGAYVFVQEPGKACLGCYLGASLSGVGITPCPGTPAVIDVLDTIGGLALYAISSLVMPRLRTWNQAKVYMATAESQNAFVDRDPECPFCSIQIVGSKNNA